MNTENKSDTPMSIRDLWQTPKEIFNRLHSEFNFQCDVAANNENSLCHQFIGEEHDSLGSHRWLSSNWCNPPYSNITPWVEKAIKQHE